MRKDIKMEKKEPLDFEKLKREIEKEREEILKIEMINDQGGYTPKGKYNLLRIATENDYNPSLTYKFIKYADEVSTKLHMPLSSSFKEKIMNMKANNLKNLIEISRKDRPYGSNPKNERELAYIVITEFAEYAHETCGWSKFKLYDENYYDDTDGSGMHPNEPGVTAFVEVTAPSGTIYRARKIINEEIHNDKANLEYNDPDMGDF